MSSIEYLSLEENQQLKKTQDIRHKLIDSIVSEGMPDDKNTQNFLVNLLNGADNSIFNKAKLRAKSDENQDNKQIVGMMTQLLQRVNKSNKDKIRDEMPELSDEYEVNDLVPGEIDDEPNENMDYNEFQKRYEDYEDTYDEEEEEEEFTEE